MFRAYIGNLNSQVTEEALQKLFDEHGLGVTGIMLKRGYAFAECPSQTAFEQAIQKLNGAEFMGSPIVVEASTSSKVSNVIRLRGLPSDVSKAELNDLAQTYGTVKKCDLAAEDDRDAFVTITYEDQEEAVKAIGQLHNFKLKDAVLKAEFVNPSTGRLNKRSARSNGGQSNHRNPEYTLRIMVPSEFVGAIIGKKGETIRSITAESKATRIDVHGKENSGLFEKVISITGDPHCVTSACKGILNVVHKEAASANRGEVMLKMLADDRFCGRIIGKDGKTIKKIREDTETKISLSTVQETAAIYPDRVINIRGSGASGDAGCVDNMVEAESAISAILRECFEKQATNVGMGGMMMHAPMGRMSHVGSLYPAQNYYSPAPSQSQSSDSYQISVPNAAAGAIIGTAGVIIKQIIRDSGAFVRIEAKKPGDGPDPSAERVITIKGNPEACWKASYFVYDKMKTEGFAGHEEARLRTAMMIPKDTVGRVIGKGGKNVREIQHLTGAIIKVPEDPEDQGDDVLVEVYGTFTATQSAYSRIRAAIVPSQSYGGYRGNEASAHE